MTHVAITLSDINLTNVFDIRKRNRRKPTSVVVSLENEGSNE